MERTRILGALTVAWALAASAPAAPSVNGAIVVDDDGGADHTEIQDAVDAAPPGALIVVRAGQYDPFVIDDKRLTVVGEAGAQVRAGTQVLNLTAGRRVVLADLELTTLDVFDCDATVVLEDLDVDEAAFAAPAARPHFVFVGKCDDVRVRACRVGAAAADLGRTAVTVEQSAVEVSSSVLSGSDGRDSDPVLHEDGGDGGLGLRARTASSVVLARSSLSGGEGGAELGIGEEAGEGGDALRLEGSSTATVAGSPAHVFQGGDGGISAYFGTDGRAGHGALLATGSASLLRLSGALPLGGLAGSGAVDGDGLSLGSADSGGILDLPGVPDPTLEILGTAVAGGAPITFRVHAPVGSTVTLYVGRVEARRPPTAGGPGLVWPTASVPLGIVPPTGFLDHVLPVAALPAGHVLSGRALVELPITAEKRTTHSAPTVVRCP